MWRMIAHTDRQTDTTKHIISVVDVQDQLHYLSANVEGNDHNLNLINSHSEFKLQNKLADPISLRGFSWSKQRISNYLFVRGHSVNHGVGSFHLAFAVRVVWKSGLGAIPPPTNVICTPYLFRIWQILLITPIQKYTCWCAPYFKSCRHPCPSFSLFTPLFGTLIPTFLEKWRLVENFAKKNNCQRLMFLVCFPRG